jgi:Uma2 family endonuclease
MTVEKTLVTAEELLRMPGDCRRELLDGEVVEIAPAGGPHNRTITKTAIHLGGYVYEHALGEVLSGDTGIIVARNPDRVRAPDVCFFTKERMPDGVPEGYQEIVPDLVVEIVSPNDTALEVQQKTEEWLRVGVRLVWTMYPETRTIAVAQEPGSVRILHEGDTLSGEPVLPGFSIPVAALFG